MTYTVQLDFTPVYELVQSLHLYLQPSNHKTLELGPSWAKSVRAELPAELATELNPKDTALDQALSMLYVLILQAPGDRTPEAFVDWLAQLSSGDLYELLHPYTDPGTLDLNTARNRIVRLLPEWNRHYFQTLDPLILQTLHQDAVEKENMLSTVSAEEMVELATNGLRHTASEALRRIVLVPSYHNRPFTLSQHMRSLIICRYPVDLPPADPDAPAPSLLRITRSLADENRLRILRFLAGQPRTFTEIVGHAGLAKSTVHHHMVALRAAGLLHVTGHGPNVTVYSLREEAVREVGVRLLSYFTEKSE